MRSIPMTMTLVAMTVCSSVAFAHGDAKHGEAAKTDAKTAEAAKPAGDMKPAAPSVELLGLKKMNGTWAVTEKMEPSPMAPKGGEGKGTAVITSGPGGVSIMNYKSTGAMGKFEGMEVLTWDRAAGVYKSFWVDSHDVAGSTSTGKMEGDKLVFTGETVGPDGKAMSMRRTVTHTSPSEWTMVMEGSTDGGTTWTKHLTVTGKKKSGKSS